MGQINTNNYPAVDSLLDADLLIVENATHGTGTTTPKQLRENAIGTDPLQTTAQTVTGAINEIFEMATDTVVGLELGKMTSFSDGTIVTDIDLHRAPVAGDRILFYHGTSVANPSSLTTYNDGAAVTTTIGDFSLTHPAGLTLMKCVALGESLRWQTVQDITSGYTAGIGISINGTTISNSAPQLGDDIAYSRVDTVTSGALGYFSADADCLVMDFRTDAEPYNGGYTLRLTTTGASFKYAKLQDKAGNDYAEDIPSGSLVMCKSNVSGTGSESDPVVVTVLGIGNVEMAHDVEVLKDICITEKTASGNPITVTDALPYPAVSVSAEIEAIQDLHGLPFPYVGGAYKNKFDITEISDVSTAYKTKEITLKANTTYTISTDLPKNNNNSANLFFYLLDASPDTTVNGVWSGQIRTLTTGADGKFTIGYRSVDYTDTSAEWYLSHNIQIEEGNTATSYVPYSNLCPISGRTAVGIARKGKNQIPLTVSAIKAANTGGTWNDNAYTYRGIVYTLLTDSNNLVTGINVNGNNTGTTSSDLWIPVNQTIDGILNGCPSGGSSSTFLQTVWSDQGGHVASDTGSGVSVANIAITNMSIRVRGGVSITNKVFYPMIRLSNVSDATFEPYKSISATIQLGTTVYGAEINWDTGVMTVKHALLTKNTASMNNGESYPGWFDSGIKAIIGPNHNMQYTNQMLNIGTVFSANTYDNMDTLFLPRAVYGKTETEWKALAIDVQVRAELATPQTIQLTANQLQMLKGYNRLSSDGGGDLTLTYKADRLAAIEAALAAL